MKKMLLALAMMSVMTFADVHPALKEAIDSKNYKQAENLIKNVGVKDVYCPATLSAKDADKVYGKVFADSITLLLDNCDMDFSRNYLEYKCASGKNKDMCLSLLSSTDPNSWPETYAKQFCTKKNVEICAAAVERIPVEKSVPYLKAIKANKLSEMRKNNVKAIRSGDMTKAECLPKAKELYDEMLRGISNKISSAHSHLIHATTESERFRYKRELEGWEEEERKFKSESYSSICSDFQNTATFERLKMNEYYFDMPFMQLTQKAAQYYWDIHNPIIPGLVENWTDIDKLFEVANGDALKSMENIKDTLALLNALGEYMKKFKYAPYFIYKKHIIDNMKASFAENEKIDDMKKLFYCKLYPSLEKETEKLFGMAVLNCKELLKENEKINDSCEEGAELFNGRVLCENGKFEKKHWIQVRDFLVINDYDYQMFRETGEILLPGMINFIKHGHHYSWKEGLKSCPDGFRLPSQSEMQIIAEYGSDSIKFSKAGSPYEEIPIEWHNGYKLNEKNKETIIKDVDKTTVYMTSEDWKGERGVLFFHAATIDSAGKWDLKTSYKYGLSNYYGHSESINALVSILCITPVLADDYFVDSRDGKEYGKIQIGNQTWMAENLNYSDSTAYEELKGSSWCYDNLEENCTKYGRLYTWTAAQGVCPDGWHLPSSAEWNTLIAIVGGEDNAGMMLKSKNGWSNDGNGADSYSFSAFPAGGRGDGGGFVVAGYYAYFWSSREYNSSNAYFMTLGYGNEDATLAHNNKNLAFSVRCVQDSN